MEHLKIKSSICICLSYIAIVTSCRTNFELPQDSAISNQKFVTLKADIADDSSEVSTRTYYDNDGTFTWGDEEKIAVFSVSTFSEFSMTSGAKTSCATFSGEVDKSVTSTYALYPYRSDYSQTIKKGEKVINYILPNIYDDYVPGQSNLPMYSTIPNISAGSIKFHMITGALRYTMNNLPAGTSSLTFVTDKAITGKASVNVTSETNPFLETPDGEQYVTYNLKTSLTEVSNLTIDVPIPVGDYKAFAVDIKDNTGTILKSVNFAKDLTMEAGHIQKINFDYDKSTNAYSIPDTGLPSVIIVTPDKISITSKDEWTEGTLYAIRENDGTINAFGTMSMKGRGNSTWNNFPKKPYSLKLDSKVKILGMAKHKRWCLLANWMDRTMIRNAVAFEIARKCPGLAWTPSGEFVEVIMNGSHIGNYYLCEQIKVDKNRVNIAEIDNSVTTGDGITGGFIMELDVNYDESNKFKSTRKNYPWQFKDPDDINSAQFSYMQNYVNTMENALYDSEKFAAREFTNYMDLESFADWWLVYELAMNWEPNHPKSSYMNKDKNGVIKAGPVWDFDWGTFTPNTTSYFTLQSALYYDALFEDETFKALVKEKWIAQKSKFEEVYTFIDNMKTKLSASDLINHELWPISSTVNGDESMTYEEAIERLKTSYHDKLEWMDGKISSW